MVKLVRTPAMLACIGTACALLACQLGGSPPAEELPAEPPTAESQPIVKNTPTVGGVPVETTVPTEKPTEPPTATTAPTQAPPSGGGTSAAAEVMTMTSYASADRVFHVIGVIVNNGELPFWQIQVKFDVLDQAGVVMDTVTGYAGYALLFPGEITPFEASFADPFPRAVAEVQVSLEGEPMSYAHIEQNSYLNSHTHACELLHVEGRSPEFGDYEVVGEVRNSADQSITDVGISVMVFDAADNLLAAELRINPDKYVIGEGLVLAPGETSTFDVWIGTLATGGEPARIEVGCEGVKTE